MKQCDYYERRHGINKDPKSFWIIIVHRQRTERYACTRSRTLIKLYKVAFTGQLCSVLLCQPWKSLDERKNAPRAIRSVATGEPDIWITLQVLQTTGKLIMCNTRLKIFIHHSMVDNNIIEQELHGQWLLLRLA